jgi:hypothetical protein
MTATKHIDSFDSAAEDQIETQWQQPDAVASKIVCPDIQRHER